MSATSPVLWTAPTPAPRSPVSQARCLSGSPLPRPPPGVALRGSHGWGGDGSLLFPRRLSHHSTSSTPPGSLGLHLQALHPVHGLRPPSPGSAPDCAPSGATVSTRQTSLHVADWRVALALGELDPALQRPNLSVRWRATTQVAWPLLWSDFHRQVIVSLQDAMRVRFRKWSSTANGDFAQEPHPHGMRLCLAYRPNVSGRRRPIDAHSRTENQA